MATLETGASAPDFILPDVNGQRYTLSDALRQGPVLLAFWKTDCATTRLAFPYLERRFDLAWLLFTVFLLAAFVATRTISIWPIGAVEELDPLGIISKAVEVATLAMLVVLLRSRAVKRLNHNSASHANGP